jgi:hypothetical protein
LDPSWAAIFIVAVLFFATTVWSSYARWADFRYRTFDLAFYTQGIWQFLHGRFAVTVESVPLLGNHVEPIVFLIAPLFAIFRHPMTFVVVQNAALAMMGPVGFDIGKRLGLGAKESWFLAAALLVAPAAGYIAVHEFHPEALTAPLLLLMVRARLLRSLAQHWFWFIAVLACKENMALLLAGYCVIQLLVQRKRGQSELSKWYIWPLILAVGWFLICVLVITNTQHGTDRLRGPLQPDRQLPGDILAKLSPSAADRKSASAIARARELGLGLAPSLPLLAASQAPLVAGCCPDPAPAPSPLALVRMEHLLSLCRSTSAVVFGSPWSKLSPVSKPDDTSSHASNIHPAADSRGMSRGPGIFWTSRRNVLCHHRLDVRCK